MATAQPAARDLQPMASDPAADGPAAGADADADARVEALVQDLIGRVADKWTMIVLEVLGERGRLRFTQLGALVDGISQKMLTQTLRQMERDGLLTRTVHPVVPPRVEYELTPLGLSLGAAFCGVWVWAAEHLAAVERARASFDQAAGVNQSERSRRT
jgi:DNA-binding HxlR family transcriptional regulator